MLSGLRACLLASVIFASAFLAGCGPGVEGTGTGDGSVSVLSLFGATEKSVCTSSFAPQLDCQSIVVVGPSIAAAVNGTDLIRYSDRFLESNTTSDFKKNSVVLEAVAERLQFAGDWGVTPHEPAGRFYGRYTIDGMPGQFLGSLAVTSSGEAIVVTLHDAFGSVIFGPATLRSRFARPVIGPGK